MCTVGELSDSKANFIGRLPLSLESNSGVASALLNIQRYDLDLEYYRQYAARIRKVTREEVLKAAQKFIDTAASPMRLRDLKRRIHMKLASGVDLIEVERVRDAISRHGDRFLKRVFTLCRVGSLRRARGIAGRPFRSQGRRPPKRWAAVSGMWVGSRSR